jgi:hypothetical protein
MAYFRLTVVETVTNWGYIELEAASPKEAEQQAQEEYDPDQLEHSSVEVQCFDAVEITENERRSR